jgi:glycosyltransferase involved in cell wall biosynthesis
MSEPFFARIRLPEGRRFDAAEVTRLVAGLPALAPCGPSVLMAGRLTAMLSPGGGEVQMQYTARGLAEQGVRVRFWRPWEERLAEADVVHLFGSQREHLPLVHEARRRGLAVVLSPITWFDWRSLWREPWPMRRRVAACAKFWLRSAAPMLPSWRRELYQACNLLLPNSAAEAEQLVRYFGVDPRRIHVVVNGADERFAHGDGRLFARRAGGFHFVLYSGRIEPRKNQLGFLHAMRGTNVPIVILGDPVPGHEAYHAACRRVAGDNVRFLPRIEHDDPLLASAYAACGCLVLASWYETPGLVALEAGMSGVPLVLPAAGCTREYFGPLAEYVHPTDHAEIRTKVLAALGRPRSPELAAKVREHYSWQAACRATRDAYATLL